MCFSATASFALSGVLAPTGLFCLYRASNLGPGWLAFALFPLAFAVQQALEGMVWLGLDQPDAQLAAIGATGFVFFSHFFWLIWVPLSVYLMHRNDADGPPGLAAFMVAGAVLGIMLYAPVLALDKAVPVSTAGRSIVYDVPLLLADSEWARFALKLIYFVIVVGSLGRVQRPSHPGLRRPDCPVADCNRTLVRHRVCVGLVLLCSRAVTLYRVDAAAHTTSRLQRMTGTRAAYGWRQTTLTQGN
jgi:hypothetical protein